MSKMNLADMATALPLSSLLAAPCFPAVVPFPRWQRARDCACAALLAGQTRLLLTGPVGSGKTLLVRDIARVMGYLGWQLEVRRGNLPHATVSSQANHPMALLVDEADRLTDGELHQLEAARRRALVLAGSDELALRWTAGTRISLSYLTQDEAREYVARWLALAGQDTARFEGAAVEHMVQLASGMPRLLSALLGATLGLAAGTASVTRRHVEDAATLRCCRVEARSQPASPTRRPALGRAAPANPAPHSAPERMPVGPEPLRHPSGRRGWLVTTIIVCAAAASAAGVAFDRLLPTAATPARPVEQAVGAPAEAATGPGTPAKPVASVPKLSITDVPESAATPAEPAANLRQHFVADLLQTATAPASPVSAAPVQAEEAPRVDLVPQPVLAPEELSVHDRAATMPDLTAPEPTKTPPIAETNAAAQPAEIRAAPLSPELVETLVRRGREMLALNDFSAARLLFARAARAGHVGAMLALARTYDPTSFSGVGSRPVPDSGAAVHWYRLAAAAGNMEAAALLTQLEQHAAK